LVASGRAAEAQAIILKELNSQFGGSAQAAAGTYVGQINLLKINMDNLAQTVGMELLPGLTEVAAVLNLLLTWNDKVEGALEQHGDEVLKTATSYAEYRAELLRANEAAGRYRNEVVKTTGAGKFMAATTRAVIDETNILTEAEFNAARAADKMVAAWDAGDESLRRFVPVMQSSGKSMEEVYADIKTAAEESAKKQKEVLDSVTDYWGTVFGSGLGKSVEEFKTKQGDLRTEISSTRDKIKELEARSYLTTAQKAELDDLKTKLGDLQDQYRSEADAHRDRTAKIVFDLLVQKATIDGVITDSEYGFITRMGTALGIFDETMATVLSEGNLAWGEFNSGNVAAAEERLWNIQRTLNGMPTTHDWTLNIRVNGSIPPALGEVGLGGDSPVRITPGQEMVPVSGARAEGGPVSAGTAYVVGERGPEMFVPDTSGRIVPNGAGGDTYNFYVSNNAAAALAAAVVNDKRRQRRLEFMGG